MESSLKDLLEKSGKLISNDKWKFTTLSNNIKTKIKKTGYYIKKIEDTDEASIYIIKKSKKFLKFLLFCWIVGILYFLIVKYVL